MDAGLTSKKNYFVLYTRGRLLSLDVLYRIFDMFHRLEADTAANTQPNRQPELPKENKHND